MNQTEEILSLINMLGLEVSSGVLTSEEAAELMNYGFVIDC